MKPATWARCVADGDRSCSRSRLALSTSGVTTTIPMTSPSTSGTMAVATLVYASGTTPAETAARAAGIPVAGGLELLAAQAEASFQLWTGTTPPPGVMYRSVDKQLKAPIGGAEA